MKKIITISIVFLCLSILNLPYAFCQDTTMANDNEQMENDTAQKCCNCHIALGAEIGLNMTDFLYSQNNGGITSKPLTRGRVGAIVDIPLYGCLYLQPGIFYAMNGADGDNDTWRINTIEIPVNLIFKFQMANTDWVFIGAGPFIGYNISGTENEGSLKIGSGETDNIKALDYGIGVNGGYEMGNGLFFRARYQWGLANLQPQSNSYISTINSESYGIQVGYFFGRKHGQCAPKDSSQEPPSPNVWDE